MNKCPKCGKELRSRIEGSTQIIECSSCDYSVVTSYIDPIHEDNQEYRIIIDGCESRNKKTYIALSRIAGTNVLGVKRLLDNTPTELLVGKAAEIKDVLDSLNENNVNYHIVPEFKY